MIEGTSREPAALIEMNTRVLEYNDREAASLRSRFASAGTRVANLISAPGTGKTELVIQVCEELLARGVAVAVLVGDCATDNDARRISRVCRDTRQIVTEGLCHLEASMIQDSLEGWELSAIDLLFVENVGNLVCPSDFDLGESVKVALLSVTEGEDKPIKYPHLFSTADLVVVTKMDLVDACGTDMEEMLRNIKGVNPLAEVVETSSRSKLGVERLATVLMGAQRTLGDEDNKMITKSGRRCS
ncbi:MAG: hydrogenase nickel incorporation protein HypB [Ferrimicrobium sp.]